MKFTRAAAARILLVAAVGMTGLQQVSAEAPSRIREHLEDGRTFQLAGNTHPRLQDASDLGAVQGSFVPDRMRVNLQMSEAQQKDLDQLLADQQNRASAQFHKWLTPEQFADRFGASKSDIAKITAWLKSEGFSDVEVSRTRTSVSMYGTAAHVEAALQTSLHRFQGASMVHYANTSDPVLPLGLQGMVRSISGLNNFHPKPHAHRSRPRFTSSITGNTFVAPGDFATIYDLNALYNQGIDGTGEKIAIAGETDINTAQVAAFRSAAGLTANTPQVVLNGRDPGVLADEQGEAYLDVEWAGAVAPKATVIYVNSTDVFESVQYVIDDNVAPVLSITYGYCESGFGNTATYNSLFQTGNAEGITIMAAAGDSGAADCDGETGGPQAASGIASQGLAVDFPASSPYVTGIGGTEFNEGSQSYWSSTNNTGGASAVSYIPEMVWNDTATAGELSAGGGGVSALFTKPSWQVGANVPSDGMRDVPDVSLNASVAHDPYLICASDGTVRSGGQLQAADCTNGFRAADTTVDVVGGTSAGAPSFAGIVALMNQLYNGPQGNINTRLYALASTSTDAFHDIVTGSNQVPCAAGSPNCPSSGELGYFASQGYDLATGLGSVDGTNLVDEWQPGFQLTVSPSTAALAAGGSTSATVQVTPSGAFSDTVTLSCSVSSALINTTCSIPSSVTSPGTVTLTINRTANALLMPSLWRSGRGRPWLGVGACGLMLISLLAFRPRRQMPLAATALAFLCVVVTSSCGGDSSSSSSTNVSTVSVATPVTGTITVTGVSGSITHTASLSLTED